MLATKGHTETSPRVENREPHGSGMKCSSEVVSRKELGNKSRKTTSDHKIALYSEFMGQMKA